MRRISMRRISWLLLFIVLLLVVSSGIFSLRYAIYHDSKGMFIYVLQASAFAPISLILVTIVLQRLLAAFERHRREERGLEKVRFKGHAIISGWNGHLDSILDNLISCQPDTEIVLVNLKAPEDMNQFLLRYRSARLRFVRGDLTSGTILELANAPQAATIIVVSDTAQGDISGADQRAILATLAARTLSPKARICVEVTGPAAAPHVCRAGADEVIVHGEHDPFLITSAATAEGVLLAMRTLLSHHGSCLQQKPIREEFVGKNFRELSAHFRDRHNAILVGLVQKTVSLGVKDVLAEDYSAVDEFIDCLFKEAGQEHLISQLEADQAKLNPGADYVIRRNEAAIVIAS